jgi:hypothetical protein
MGSINPAKFAFLGVLFANLAILRFCPSKLAILFLPELKDGGQYTRTVFQQDIR